MDIEQATNFPAFFVANLLRSIGFPQRSGIFGKKTVPGRILSGAILQMTQTSIGLGAGRPLLACKLLMQLFGNRDWVTNPGDEFFSELDPNDRINQDRDNLPWVVLTSDYLPQPEDSITWAKLGKPKVQLPWASACGQGLIWSIAHPESASRALNLDRERYCGSAPGMRDSGLDIPLQPSFLTNEAFFEQAENIVGSYQTFVGELPSPAPELLAAAPVQRRLVSQ